MRGDPMRLEGRCALITGGSGGIGGAIAEAFVREGARVVCASRSAEVARGTEGSGPLTRDRVDVRDPDSVSALVARTVERFGRLDILVTAAGVMFDAKVADLSPDALASMLSTNVLGTMLCVSAAARAMRTNGGGHVITVSSAIARVPAAGTAAYAATKGAVEAFTRTAAAELANETERSILVNCLAPGFVDAGLSARVISHPKIWPPYRSHIALGRPARREEVAGAAVFLATDTYMVGHVMQFNGGFTWP
jgi:3-oxoacyl-[acyl-carrier protein] reductase